MKPYYGIFYPLENGWGVRFPDAPGVHTCGDNLDEAKFMAVDALNGMLVVGRKGREYQEPVHLTTSGRKHLKQKKGVKTISA